MKAGREEKQCTIKGMLEEGTLGRKQAGPSQEDPLGQACIGKG
jgi:hypothetical protein